MVKPDEPATTLTSSFRDVGPDGRVRAAPSPPRMVTINGKYALERRLGCGGMAEVFLAQTLGAEGFTRRVALKRVLEAYSDQPQLAAMFVAEAQITARLKHPNIVSVLDFDREATGRLFLVMELVDGADLSKLIESGPLPLPIVVHLVIEILRGLVYAHDLPHIGDDVRGVIHRDLSPHNILLSWEGEVKISDFGIAKVHAASRATASQVIKGKPAYMSPEQVRSERLDGRSDLFAVGAMLFEMLCGRPPFVGDNSAAIIGQVMFADIPDPRTIRPDIPADVARVVVGLLQRDRNKRTQKASLAIEALVTSASYAAMGREQLVALMAERFAARAPVRAPATRSPHALPTLLRRPAANTVVESSSVPTVMDRPAARELLAPVAFAAGTPVTMTSDLGAMSAAPPPRRRWSRQLLASALVFAIGGAVTAAIIKSTSESPTAPASPTTTAQPPPSSPAIPPLSSPPPTTSSSSAPGGSGSATAPAAVAAPSEAAGAVTAAPLAPPPPTMKADAPAAAAKARPARKPPAPPPSAESDGLGVLHLKP